MLANPLPDCILLYFFAYSSCPVLCWCIRQIKPYPFFLILVFLLFLRPIVLVFVILMFPGKLFLLIISYLATKDVPLGNLTCFGTARQPRSIFCLIVAFSYAYHQKNFLIKVLLLHQECSSCRCNKSERDSSASLFSILSFFTPNIPNTFSYRLFSPHSNKSSSV